ncbi:MAG: flagellar basal body-associated FliL family protein [Firmicutes bacterium]|nr:flagellar basal body-associated FliL family protein [Bacillota bacterium]
MSSLKKTLPRVLLFLIIGLVFLGGSAGVAFLVVSKTTAAPAKPPVPLAKALDLGQFTTNLANSEGRRFIQTKITVEVDSDQTIKVLTEKSYAVRDLVLRTLRSKAYEDVAGDKGMLSLGREIQEKLGGLIKEGKILNLYFVEFVVQ